MMKLATVVAVLILAAPVLAQEVRVIDGDTFELDGEVIRLWGIDAPELDQTCGAYRAGEAALEALGELLDGDVPCEAVDVDQYGRTVARCLLAAAGDRNSRFSIRADIGSLLVGAGHAWDWPQYSNGMYGDAQDRAQASGSGVWGYDCIPPWEWRERNSE